MSKLDEQLFNLKFTSKQMQKGMKKAEKREQDEKKKVKLALEKGNVEAAKIYAQNAIREKNEALSMLRLSSRLDSVASKLEAGIKMNQVGKAMAGVVKNLDPLLKTMDLAKMTAVMDKFAELDEDFAVRDSVMQDTMAHATSSSMPADQVDTLIAQVADEHGLKISEQLAAAMPGKNVQSSATKEDELIERMNKLKSVA